MKEPLISYKHEELLNTASHALGAALGIPGACLLLVENSFKSPYAIPAILLYSFTFILLFTASALYHLARNPVWKKRLRILDHISIFYLIAGTYTPVCLIGLHYGNGWFIFYTVWGIAFLGTFLKIFFTGRFEVFSLLLYLAMGWLIVFDLEDLIALSSPEGLGMLALGGAFYTFGILFYSFRRIPYNHLIWHFFVLGGALSHWFYIRMDII